MFMKNNPSTKDTIKKELKRWLQWLKWICLAGLSITLCAYATKALFTYAPVFKQIGAAWNLTDLTPGDWILGYGCYIILSLLLKLYTKILEKASEV
jgi:hypothetical protein